jgi:hypothetical protein
LVPRAKTTSASGQLSAEATGAVLGETSRPAAATSAEAPWPTQRPADRTLPARGLRMRLENTPKFYPHGARVHHGQPFPLPQWPAIPIAPMASHSYCPKGNSKYAYDNIYQLTSWPSQYLVPIMGSCHTYQGASLRRNPAVRRTTANTHGAALSRLVSERSTGGSTVPRAFALVEAISMFAGRPPRPDPPNFCPKFQITSTNSTEVVVEQIGIHVQRHRRRLMAQHPPGGTGAVGPASAGSRSAVPPNRSRQAGRVRGPVQRCHLTKTYDSP